MILRAFGSVDGVFTLKLEDLYFIVKLRPYRVFGKRRVWICHRDR
jgi:hypothetical protein